MKKILIFLLFFSYSGFASMLSDLRYSYHSGQKIRIVLETDEKLEFKKFALSDPPRIVIDFPNAKHSVRPNINIDKGAVMGIRTGYRNENTLRIVIDLNSDARNEIFKLEPDHDNSKHRIVLDIFDGTVPAPTLQLSSMEDVVKKPTKTNIPIQPNKHSPSYVKQKPTQTASSKDNGKIEKNINKNKVSSSKKDKMVICVDAGHGGTDQGAHNPITGLKEKDIVFKIAKLTKQELNKRGYYVYMTRQSDTKIEVNDRPKLCRKAGGDIFVSIHADSVPGNTGSGGPRGASVYILNMYGADKQLNRYLNKQANAQNLQWNLDVYGYNRNTQAALLSMQMEATSEASMILAKQTLKELGKIGRIAKSSVKYENFGVLRGATEFPAILVETGFISNLEEARLLSTFEHQQKLAKGIANGIDSYLKLHMQQHHLLKK